MLNFGASKVGIKGGPSPRALLVDPLVRLWMVGKGGMGKICLDEATKEIEETSLSEKQQVEWTWLFLI